LTYATNCQRFIGKDNVADDMDTCGTVTANPIEQVFFHVWCAPVQPNDIGAIDICSVLKYNAKFIQPAKIPLS